MSGPVLHLASKYRMVLHIHWRHESRLAMKGGRRFIDFCRGSLLVNVQLSLAFKDSETWVLGLDLVQHELHRVV